MNTSWSSTLMLIRPITMLTGFIRMKYKARPDLVGQKVTFNIVNMTKKESLFGRGLTPHIQSLVSGENLRSEIEDVRYTPTLSEHQILFDSFLKENENTYEDLCFHTLHFTLTLKTSEDHIMFAQTRPWTYTQQTEYQQSLQNTKEVAKHLHIEKIGQTTLGLEIPMLIITQNISGALGNWETFARKRRVVVLTSRVHPGESNSSYICKGALDFLIGGSKEAALLRSTNIFFIFPMLNPDGVVKGHYRCCSLGYDLNRMWDDPKPKEHPTIYLVKNQIQKIKNVFGEISLFYDVHGHSKNHGAFLYGCQYGKEDAEFFSKDKNQNASNNRVIAFVHALQSQFFDFNKCTFKLEKYKTGTARIALFRNLKIIRSFTLECSYSFSNPSDILCDSSQAQDEKCFERFGTDFITAVALFADDEVLSTYSMSLKSLCQLQKQGNQNAIDDFWKTETDLHRSRITSFFDSRIKTLFPDLEPNLSTPNNKQPSPSGRWMSSCKISSTVLYKGLPAKTVAGIVVLHKSQNLKRSVASLKTNPNLNNNGGVGCIRPLPLYEGKTEEQIREGGRDILPRVQVISLDRSDRHSHGGPLSVFQLAKPGIIYINSVIRNTEEDRDLVLKMGPQSLTERNEPRNTAIGQPEPRGYQRQVSGKLPPVKQDISSQLTNFSQSTHLTKSFKSQSGTVPLSLNFDDFINKAPPSQKHQQPQIQTARKVKPVPITQSLGNAPVKPPAFTIDLIPYKLPNNPSPKDFPNAYNLPNKGGITNDVNPQAGDNRIERSKNHLTFRTPDVQDGGRFESKRARREYRGSYTNSGREQPSGEISNPYCDDHVSRLWKSKPSVDLTNTKSRVVNHPELEFPWSTTVKKNPYSAEVLLRPEENLKTSSPRRNLNTITGEGKRILTNRKGIPKSMVPSLHHVYTTPYTLEDF